MRPKKCVRKSAYEKVRPKKSYFLSAWEYVKLPFSLRVPKKYDRYESVKESTQVRSGQVRSND
jgi:hypothetical protein